jgi:hypothetical protein
MGQYENAGMSGTGNLPTVLQSDLSLAGTKNPPGPEIASYGRVYVPSNTLGFLSSDDGGQFFNSSDLESTQSPMTSLFSEAPCSITTCSSFGPILAPVDPLAELMKEFTNDAFVGYD